MTAWRSVGAGGGGGASQRGGEAKEVPRLVLIYNRRFRIATIFICEHKTFEMQANIQRGLKIGPFEL